MKNILLIGAGHFGRHIAMQLSQLGHQVMAADTDEERINDVISSRLSPKHKSVTVPMQSFYVLLASGILTFASVTISGNFQTR